MSKALVTGATGFVGQHLVEALKENNRDITCIVRSKNIPPHLQHPNIEICHADLMNKDQLSACIKETETVFHVAGHATLRTKSPSELTVNTQGTQNLVEACIQANTMRKFIYISSLTAVAQPAGQKLQKPIDETCTQLPDTAYGRSKRDAEMIVQDQCQKTKMPYVILRPALVYGPNSRSDAGLLALHQAVTKGSLISKFNWPGTVSLIYVKDLIKACLMVEQDARANNQTYLISDGEPITFGNLFQILSQSKKQWPMPKSMCKIANKIYDMCDQTLSISKWIPAYVMALLGPSLACSSQRLQKDLHFQPDYTLSAGLSETLGN